MKTTKNVLYTFTNDINAIHIPEIENQTFGKINEKNTVILKLSSINSEISKIELVGERYQKELNTLVGK